MARFSCLGAVALILCTASLASGAPEPAPAPAAGQASPVAPPAAAPQPGSDGYGRTISYFQTTVKKAAEIESVLRTVQAEAAAASSDPAKQQALFLKKLKERYVDATFDGKVGTVTFQKPFVVHFTGALKVDRLVEEGKVTLEYLVTQNRIQISNDANAVTIILDLAEPTKSSFINVAIPEIRREAEKIVIDPDRKRVASDSVETAVLNDAYQLLGLTSNERMDVFATSVIRNSKYQDQVLKVAANGYRDRHPQDYQAVDPSQKKKKKVDDKPNKPADQRFYKGFLRFSAFLLLAAAVIGLIVKAIGALKALSASPGTAQGLRKNQYRSLTPLVKRSMNKAGRSLWGINLPWKKKYHIYERKNRWLLCDGIEDKEKKISQARTRIEVFLRSTYFKIMVTRHNNTQTNIWLHTNDFSKRDLVKGLQEICYELTNPSGRDDGSDDAETVPAEAAASLDPAAGTGTPEEREPSETFPAADTEEQSGSAAPLPAAGLPAVGALLPAGDAAEAPVPEERQPEREGVTSVASGPEPFGSDALEPSTPPFTPPTAPPARGEEEPPSPLSAAPPRPAPGRMEPQPETSTAAGTGADGMRAAPSSAERKRPPRWSLNPRLRR